MDMIIGIVAGAIFLTLAWSWLFIKNPAAKSVWDWVAESSFFS